MSEKNEKTTPVRTLEKDAQGVILPFTTKKGKYFVLPPGSPIGIRRWTEFEKLKIVLGAGKTFSAIMETLQSVERLLGADRPLAEVRVEAILAVNGLRRGMMELSQARYNQALYLATIFIYRDGDDPLVWSYDRATEYIEDWAEEGLSEQDFFSFSLATVSGFKEHLTSLRQEVKREEAALSAIGGLAPTEAAALP